MLRCLRICFLLSVALPAHAADLRFAIAADAGKTTDNSAAARASMERADTFDLILPGDNLYTSTYSDVWTPWTDRGFRFAVTAIGNHNAGYAAEMRFFEMPGEYYAKPFGSSVRFIVLNSDNVSNARDQAAFLDRELAAAREPFIFLVYHHPTYTLSHFHNWEEKRDFQLAVRPVIARYRSKITALLLGHDHLALLAHYNDLPVVIAGAIWETRSDTPVNNTQDGVRVTTNWFYDGQAHWASLVVDEQDNQAVVQFIRSRDNSLQCEARIATGSAAELSSECR